MSLEWLQSARESITRQVEIPLNKQLAKLAAHKAFYSIHSMHTRRKEAGRMRAACEHNKQAVFRAIMITFSLTVCDKAI